jgi:hypothetical protein
MILNCKCNHVSQDTIHGKSKRVHNKTGKDTYRCTVCGNEKGSGSFATKKGKR